DDCGLRQAEPSRRPAPGTLSALAGLRRLPQRRHLAPEQIKKEGPAAQNCGAFWRRWRDSNSRRAFDPYTISNRARSTNYATSPRAARTDLIQLTPTYNK